VDFFANLSASSFPGRSVWPGTHCTEIVLLSAWRLLEILQSAREEDCPGPGLRVLKCCMAA
jgi:hypothetical protein